MRAVNARSFRDALGRFASGVCVVTTRTAEGRQTGVTISSFTSLSLDPPLVLFCIGTRSANLASYLDCTTFAVNVLGEGQERLSEAFASQVADKFTGVAGEIGESGCFLIDDALVTIECRRTAIHPEGDHFIVVGAVDRVRTGPLSGPLLRFRGCYGRFAGFD